MKSRLFLLLFGVALCSGLAWAWIRAREETHRRIAERRAVESSDEELERQTADLKTEITSTTEEIAKTRLVIAATADPAARARANVGSLVARLKQEHTLHPPPAPPIPPPSGPQGDFFPELMSDPEYNLLYAITVRSTVEQQNRSLLKKLGVKKELADQIIDLLTEREMVASDHRSIIGFLRGTPGDIYEKYQAYRSEIETKIRTLLGDELYQGFSEDIVRDAFSRDEDGNQKVTRTITRGIPEYRAEKNLGLQPLDIRLSYSPSPLTDGQKKVLNEWLLKNSVQWPTLRSEPFLEKLHQVLTPDQQLSLEELQIEDAARGARGKLPKTETTPSKPKP